MADVVRAAAPLPSLTEQPLWNKCKEINFSSIIVVTASAAVIQGLKFSFATTDLRQLDSQRGSEGK